MKSWRHTAFTTYLSGFNPYRLLLLLQCFVSIEWSGSRLALIRSLFLLSSKLRGFRNILRVDLVTRGSRRDWRGSRGNEQCVHIFLFYFSYRFKQPHRRALWVLNTYCTSIGVRFDISETIFRWHFMTQLMNVRLQASYYHVLNLLDKLFMICLS